MFHVHADSQSGGCDQVPQDLALTAAELPRQLVQSTPAVLSRAPGTLGLPLGRSFCTPDRRAIRRIVLEADGPSNFFPLPFSLKASFPFSANTRRSGVPPSICDSATVGGP